VTGNTWFWQGTTYADGMTLQSDDPTAYTLELLADGSALVRADCNSLAGTYTMAEDGSLALDLPSEGLSNCGEASLAMSYLSDLNKAGVFSLADGGLYLKLEADAGSMEFAEPGATVAAPHRDGRHAGRRGHAHRAGLGLAVAGHERRERHRRRESSTVHCRISGGRTLKLLADCNTGGGTYTTENGSLTIEASALTRMACPPGSLSNEYVARLNEVASYVIDGGQLYLNLKMDSGNMVFAPLSVERRRRSGRHRRLRP